MTRDMYLPNMLPDNNIEKELEDNDECIKKFIKKNNSIKDNFYAFY